MKRALLAFLPVLFLTLPAAAQEVPLSAPREPVIVGELPPPPTSAHAIAMHGEPKYGPDFQHFDYVNPEAPKGGDIRLGATGTFDTFNGLNARGDAPSGLGLISDTLLVSSADEAFTEYGLLAETVTWPEDRSWVEFTLREEARWHDGVPVSVEDVLFTFNFLKTEAHPFFQFYYAAVESAEEVGPNRVRFTFAEAENRELPLIVGQMTILPKHYWQDRDMTSPTLEPPLGSGPYRIGNFEAGRYITYERVEDYWAADLPVSRGLYNFASIRYDYYLDPNVEREALKAGQLDFREENTAKSWATDYDIPAVADGRLILETIDHERPTGMQAFVMNTRQPVFADPLVRRALAFAFDFEWTNRNLFYSQYTRTQSYFSNSELASHDLPSGAELAVLQPFRNLLPPEVFNEAYSVPTTSGDGWPRDNLTEAFELLAEAGWVVRDLKLVNEETGEQMRFEILLVSQAFERIVLPFARNLTRLGIEVSVRLVDSSQFINRLRAFDFDMIVGGWGQSASPGNEQLEFWSSHAAATPGSRNYAGIADPVVDALIAEIIAAPDRESLIARTRALDRVLLWNHLVIPHWHIRNQRLVYWNIFERPEIVPKDGTSIMTWWIDPERVAALGDRRRAPQGNADEIEEIAAFWPLLGLAALGLGLAVYLRRRRRMR